GIRDKLVTGVQTCALPILPAVLVWGLLPILVGLHRGPARLPLLAAGAGLIVLALAALRPKLIALLPVFVALELVSSGLGHSFARSEERRVGKEGRILWAA